jgi:IS1 family transposase
VNVLKIDRQIAVLQALVEGNSIRSIERMFDVHRDTVMRLGVRIGQQCQQFHSWRVRDVRSRRIQADEIWAYVGKKQRNVQEDDVDKGDFYTYVGMDAETKLAISYLVDRRTASSTHEFMGDLRNRLNNHVQLTTDSFWAYREAVDVAFGADVSYGMIQKIFQDTPGDSGRYSSGRVIGAQLRPQWGEPDIGHISTSYVERQNLTMRMHMRRFTRLTNGFSKRLENLRAAVALHFAHYNFIRVHSTLRTTPAVATGLVRTEWSWEELLEAMEPLRLQEAG